MGWAAERGEPASAGAGHGAAVAAAARASIADGAQELAALAVESGLRPVILIDGRSGSGKTTLGRALAPLIPGAQLVELDDVYPGWHGLAAASLAVSESIAAGTPRGHHRWNWSASTRGTWRSLDPAAPLVVEGAGALSVRSAPLATLRIWVELPDAERFARVLVRGDGDTYARTPWWDIWAAQEEAHLRENRPDELADLVVAG